MQVRLLSTIAFITTILLVSASLIHSQVAAAATVNGHIEPTGKIEAGKQATLVLDISTSPIFGNEFVDSDGRFLFEVKATLRLVGHPDFEPIPFGQGGLGLQPATAHQVVQVVAPHNLTKGKWLINATVYQYDSQHNGMVVDMNPNRWDFDVDDLPLEKDIGQQIASAFVEAPAEIAVGVIVAIITILIGFWLTKWSKKKPRDADPNRPIFQWEWFEEQVQRSPDKFAKIRIYLREKHADRARVFVEGTQLTWERSGNKEFNMTAGNAGNLIIPPHLVSPDSKVSLRWGKNFSMNDKLRNIPKVNE